MLRLLLVALTILLFLILGVPVLLFETWLSKADSEKSAAQCRRIVQAVFRAILTFSGTELVVEGAENIPEEPALFVGNHRSYFDVVTSYTQMRRKTGYIAKMEMIKIPLLKQWMDRIGCLFLNRQDVREGLKTILQAISDVRAGSSLVIYPEGTRNRNPNPTELLEFKEGSLKIAQKAPCPVIPMAVIRSEHVYEAHLPWIRKAKVVLRFGEPINLKELPPEYKKKPALYVQEEIGRMIADLCEKYPDAV